MARRGSNAVRREVDVAAALLVARSRVVVLTLAVLAAGLAFDESGHPGVQYALAFGALPLAVALALAADRLPATVTGAAGAAIDVGVFVVALLTFPSAIGVLGASFLLPVLLASYTGGRQLGLLIGGAGIAAVAAADLTDRAAPSGELLLLLVIAVAVILAIVGRADARLVRSASRARYHETRATLLLDRLAEPVVVTSSSGYVVQLNDAARDLLDARATTTGAGPYPCAAVLALHLEGRPLDCSSGCALRRIEGSDRSAGVEATVHPTTSREPVPVLVSVVEVPAADGGDVEYLHTVRDITRLKRADEAKTLFLATATHELKTPLTVIRGFLDTITQPGIDDAVRIRAINVMRQRAGELSAIIERVLLASRIESGHLDVELEPLDVVATARDRVAALAAATGRTIALRVDPPTVAPMGTSVGLATVLDHLLDNACKYSPPSSLVELRVATDDESVQLLVRDEGAGMTDEEAAHCFERFWQADPSSRRRVGGTGIGLYIVKSLVESMGGSVAVTSVLGEGTTFTVRLRRSDVVPEAATGAEVSTGREPSIVREFMRQIGVETTTAATGREGGAT